MLDPKYLTVPDIDTGLFTYSTKKQYEEYLALVISVAEELKKESNKISDEQWAFTFNHMKRN